jgi:copper chaperone CopZ
MKVALFNVENTLCAECSLALRRFIGGMDGVEEINVESGKLAVRYDEGIIPEEKLTKLTKDSIERLGYRLEE